MADRLQILTSMYQADRADRSATLTVSLATMGAAVTYLVGTIAFYDKIDLLGWAITLLPFPLVCIAAFHATLLNVTALRARSILALERELVSAATIPGVDMSMIGVIASERATNVHTAPLAQRFALIVAYGGVGIIYLAYITLMLIKAARHVSGWIAVPITAYTLLLVPIALAWHKSTTLLDFRASADESGRPGD